MNGWNQNRTARKKIVVELEKPQGFKKSETL